MQRTIPNRDEQVPDDTSESACQEYVADFANNSYHLENNKSASIHRLTRLQNKKDNNSTNSDYR